MRAISLAFALSVAGMLVGCLLSFIAATSWSSFDQFFLLAGCLGPGLAAGMSPRLRRNGEPPPPVLASIAIVLIGTAIGIAGAYVSFVIVSMTWSKGSILSGLLDPSSVPAIVSSTSRGSRSETTLASHCAISVAVSFVFTLIIYVKSRRDD